MEEDIKNIAREEMLDTIKTRLDSAMIFTYVDNLEKENKQLKETINELREYIKSEKVIKDGNTLEQITNYEKNILEILGDKE